MPTIPEEIDFAPAAREFLTAFYKGHRIAPEDTSGKIKALRSQFIKEDMLIASAQGILDDKSELRALEHYVLDSLNFTV